MPQLQPRQSAGFVVLILAGLAVGLMLLILSDATQTMLQSPDLLVPLGLFVTVSTIFNMLATLPAVAATLAAPWSVKLLTFSFSVSVILVAIFLMGVVYVGWTTALILQVVVQGQINLLAPITIIGRWFWRMLTLELLGLGILLAISAVVLITFTASMTVALVFLGVISLAWNLLTAAVLPVVLADIQPFWPAVMRGLTVSRANMRKWAPLVIAQMVLLGWVTFIHVSYTTHETEYDGLEYSESKTNKTQTNWRVNSFWTGRYADECKWHGSLMESLDAKPLELVNCLLTLLFAVLAVAIKIRIVTDLYTPVPSYEVLSLDRQPHFPSEGFGS